MVESKLEVLKILREGRGVLNTYAGLYDGRDALYTEKWLINLFDSMYDYAALCLVMLRDSE